MCSLFCVFSVDACEQQTKNGRQMAAEALLSMESPGDSSESKTFLQGILQQTHNTGMTPTDPFSSIQHIGWKSSL